MPLHPISIVVGTTLAVIGSGYAFKKFIYDPHLAPYLDALLANYAPQAQPSPALYAPRRSVAVPVSIGQSSGTSTSRRDPYVALRRRSGRESDSYGTELRERGGLRRDCEAESLLPRAGRGEGDAKRRMDDDDGWGRVSLYELRDSIAEPARRASKQDNPFSDSRRASSTTLTPYQRYRLSSQSLIDLGAEHDTPTSPQDAEIRQVIFNYAPTPRLSGTSTPIGAGPAALNPFTPVGVSEMRIQATMEPASAIPGEVEGAGPAPQIHGLDSSTTFSFLSLSQTSSPDAQHSMLGSFLASPRHARGPSPLGSRSPAGRTPQSPSPEGQEDDIVSLPDTTASFDDPLDASSASASAYASARSRSPDDSSRRGHSLSPASGVHAGSGLGLSSSYGGIAATDDQVILDLGMSWATSPPISAGLRPGPMSVVSLSDSEGWRSDEWEVGSEQ